MKKRARIIPILLLKDDGLYKTVRFKDEKYVGDPLNAARIFNEKQCDELILLDINVSKEKKPINFKLIEEMASECFMPLAYGGGIQSLHEIEKILRSGIEKVVLNSVLFSDPDFIGKAVKTFASSTIVASVDVKKNLWGNYQVYSHSGKKIRVTNPVEWVKQLEESGVGEIAINSIDLDGTYKGYDINLIKEACGNISIPVIASGGCNGLDNMQELFSQTHVSAAAAGSMFVFHGKHRAVLISYPDPAAIEMIKI